MRFITNFQRHHTTTGKLISATRKMWLVQFISIGILLLVINARIRPTSKIFINEYFFDDTENTVILSGEYDDFHADWYGIVGVYIVISSLFASFMPWG